MKYVNAILTVPTTDPDDARRRRLLNIILMAALIASIIALIALILENIFDPRVIFSETQLLLSGIIVFTLGILGIYILNRRLRGRCAARAAHGLRAAAAGEATPPPRAVRPDRRLRTDQQLRG